MNRMNRSVLAAYFCIHCSW